MENSNRSPATDQVSKDVAPGLSACANALTECGEIAATRLSIALSDALNQVVDLLFAKGIQGAHSAEQQHWLAAADFARIRRNDIVDAFSRHLEKHYAEYCQRKLTALSGQGARLDISELRLVEVDALEYAITPDSLIEAIRNGTWLTLPELAKWFQQILGAADMTPMDMPLGPKPLGAAVALAINEQFGKPDAKQRVMKALCRPLPDLVNLFYRDIYKHVGGGHARHPDSPPSTQVVAEPDQADPRKPSVDQPAVPNQATDMVNPDSMAAAQAALAKRLARIRLPGFIADFFHGPWLRLLARIHREAGPSSPEWEQAFRTMEELLRSLSTKQSTEDARRRTRELPDLAKRLARSLETIGESADMHDQFFKRLAGYHIRLLGKLGAAAPGDRPFGSPEIIDAPGEAPGKTDAASEAPLAALEIGAWLEFRDLERGVRKLKLAWISPNRSLFLLTNHLGERALSAGPKDLADMLRSGAARVIAAPESTASGAAAAPVVQAKKTA